MIEKIEKVKVDEKQISPFLPEIYKKLDWLSREDLIKHFVSAEFNRFLDYYKGNKDIKINNDSNSKATKTEKKRNVFENLSINIGRKHSVSPIELISLINRITKTNDVEIGSIDIRQTYTIFEIDKNVFKTLIDKSKDFDFNGIGLNIKKSKDKIDKQYSKEKRAKSSRKSKSVSKYSSRQSRNKNKKNRRKFRR